MDERTVVAGRAKQDASPDDSAYQCSADGPFGTSRGAPETQRRARSAPAMGWVRCSFIHC
jgi:hypothetical protein